MVYASTTIGAKKEKVPRQWLVTRSKGSGRGSVTGSIGFHRFHRFWEEWNLRKPRINGSNPEVPLGPTPPWGPMGPRGGTGGTEGDRNRRKGGRGLNPLFQELPETTTKEFSMIHSRCEIEEKSDFTNTLNVLEVPYSLHKTPEEGVWCVHFDSYELHSTVSRLKAREVIGEAVEFLKDNEV